jgi:hypothetical protein
MAQTTERLHASDGGLYMGSEDTMGAMKDGVSCHSPHFAALNSHNHITDYYHLNQV